jgi:quercetin dioxygenase-like cupin family protein
MSGTGISREKGAGEMIWFDGGLITFKATGEQTDGAFSLFEAWMPSGKATPIGVHPGSDETFYVLEGDIVTYVDGVEGSASTGSVLVVPRGTPHAFAVTSESVRLLVLFTPAEVIQEEFFRIAGEPASSATLPPSGPPDRDRMMAAAKESGVVLLGPPPFPALTNA